PQHNRHETGEAVPVLRGGDGILRRGYGEAGPEMFAERGLVVEAGRDRAVRDRPSPLHQAAGRIEPDLGEQGIRGEAEFALEQADQLEWGHIERPGDLAQLHRLMKALLQDRPGPAEQEAVAAGRDGVRLAVAIAG